MLLNCLEVDLNLEVSDQLLNFIWGFLGAVLNQLKIWQITALKALRELSINFYSEILKYKISRDEFNLTRQLIILEKRFTNYSGSISHTLSALYIILNFFEVNFVNY